MTRVTVLPHEIVVQGSPVYAARWQDGSEIKRGHRARAGTRLMTIRTGLTMSQGRTLLPGPAGVDINPQIAGGLGVPC
jgi:hypothetical protein